MADLVQSQIWPECSINEILEEDGCSFRIESGDVEATVTLVDLSDMSDEQQVDEHPNIRLLFNRMQDAIEAKDASSVLHTSASIFETLAKDIVAEPTVVDQTLGSFFERYRKDSKLPKQIADYILSVYNERNKMPLAGHGSTKAPTINMQQAIALAELTKAIVRTERQLARFETSAKEVD